MENVPSGEYCNLDLVFRAKDDLTPLIDYFGDKIIVLCNEKVVDGYYVVLESDALGVDKYGPEGHARDFVALISDLPKDLLELWSRCESKIFVFGFRAGLDNVAYSADLGRDLLRNIVSMGASVSITIYPADAKPEESCNHPLK